MKSWIPCLHFYHTWKQDLGHFKRERQKRWKVRVRINLKTETSVDSKQDKHLYCIFLGLRGLRSCVFCVQLVWPPYLHLEGLTCESSAGKCCSSSSCCAGRRNYPPSAAEALPVRGETRCESNKLHALSSSKSGNWFLFLSENKCIYFKHFSKANSYLGLFN